MTTRRTHRPLKPDEQAAIQDCVDRMADEFSGENIAQLLILLALLLRDR